MPADFITALSKTIAEEDTPVLPIYRLGILVYRQYQAHSSGSHLSGFSSATPDAHLFQSFVKQLTELGILRNHVNFPNRAFRLFGRKNEPPGEVVCTIDPFCYLSHLSAMEHHGLTNRMPGKLFLSTPPLVEWKASASAKMEKDLGTELDHYLSCGLPELKWRQISRIGKVEVHTFRSKHQGAFKLVRGSTLRVATIGRTFLDMLRNPELCGGIHHVLEVYAEHAASWLKLITDEIDRHGAPIDKVRAGYLLDEKLGLSSPSISDWLQYAQRGGSRKLDASAEYRPVWSEKWCLSLNAD